LFLCDFFSGNAFFSFSARALFYHNNHNSRALVFNDDNKMKIYIIFFFMFRDCLDITLIRYLYFNVYENYVRSIILFWTQVRLSVDFTEMMMIFFFRWCLYFMDLINGNRLSCHISSSSTGKKMQFWILIVESLQYFQLYN